MDRTGYVPGDKIRVDVEIHNGAYSGITKSCVQLLKVALFLRHKGFWANATKGPCNMLEASSNVYIRSSLVLYPMNKSFPFYFSDDMQVKGFA